MLRVTSIRSNVIPAFIIASQNKGMISTKKMSLPSEVKLSQFVGRNSSDIANTKLAKAGCGSVETFCTPMLSF